MVVYVEHVSSQIVFMSHFVLVVHSQRHHGIFNDYLIISSSNWFVVRMLVLMLCIVMIPLWHSMINLVHHSLPHMTYIRYWCVTCVCMCIWIGVSANHLDVIPTAVYEDITVLTREHIPLLESMYARGRACILQRNIPWINGMAMHASACPCPYLYHLLIMRVVIQNPILMVIYQLVIISLYLSNIYTFMSYVLHLSDTTPRHMLDLLIMASLTVGYGYVHNRWFHHSSTIKSYNIHDGIITTKLLKIWRRMDGYETCPSPLLCAILITSADEHWYDMMINMIGTIIYRTSQW
jgi:hypothetical protein